MTPSLRDWCELLRVSALFTVPGDALAGAAAVGRAPNRGTALAAGASLCLYSAGMALNDWSDREVDAVERPDRPLPSGRVSPAAALTASAALTGTALALAARAGRTPLLTATTLAAAVWSYDLHLKHTPWSAATMASTRALDLLLGATATGARGAPPPRETSHRMPPRRQRPDAERDMAAGRQPLEAAPDVAPATRPARAAGALGSGALGNAPSAARPARSGAPGARLRAGAPWRWARHVTPGAQPQAAVRDMTPPAPLARSGAPGARLRAVAPWRWARHVTPGAQSRAAVPDMTPPAPGVRSEGALRVGASPRDRWRGPSRADGTSPAAVPVQAGASGARTRSLSGGRRAGEVAAWQGALRDAATLGAHTFAVTSVSRREAQGGGAHIALGALGAVGGVAATLRGNAAPLAAAYAATAARPLVHAVLNPSAPLLQRAVGGGIRATIPLQAALAARAAAPYTAVPLLALLPLARRLSRKVSPT